MDLLDTPGLPEDVKAWVRGWRKFDADNGKRMDAAIARVPADWGRCTSCTTGTIEDAAARAIAHVRAQAVLAGDSTEAAPV